MTSDSPTSHSFISQRLRLSYVDWGNPSAPPLVLVHGGEDHCRNWDWVAEQLRHDWHIIAPDLRGHGDSEWSSDGNYFDAGLIFDLAELIRQLDLSPVTLIGHSYGGHIALRYTGLYPELVRKLVAIEGVGPSPKEIEEEKKVTMTERMHKWIEQQRKLAVRGPRIYASVEEAAARMRANNKHLSPEQALHLTEHGVRQNPDGTYTWKFDPAVRNWPPYDIPREAIIADFGRILCPTLLVYGKESWASNPAEDGRVNYFHDAKVVELEDAGHWVHHDRLDEFVRLVKDFL